MHEDIDLDMSAVSKKLREEFSCEAAQWALDVNKEEDERDRKYEDSRAAKFKAKDMAEAKAAEMRQKRQDEASKRLVNECHKCRNCLDCDYGVCGLSVDQMSERHQEQHESLVRQLTSITRPLGR